MFIVNVLQALAALYVLGESLISLNRMSASTAHTIRTAYVVLSGGALAALASSAGASNVFECAFAVGVALLLAVDRRKHRRAHQ